MAAASQSPARNPSESHQSWLLIASLLSLVTSLSALVVRGIVKWRLYGVDDAVLAVAYVTKFDSFSHRAC